MAGWSVVVQGRALDKTQRGFVVDPLDGDRKGSAAREWHWYGAFEVDWVLEGEDLVVTLSEDLKVGPHLLCVLSGYNETWYEGGVPWTRLMFTCTEGGAEFKRGDANHDGNLDIADAIKVLSHLFSNDPAPSCPDAADANDDEKLDIADAIAILSHLFGGTGPLSPPFPECGPDPVGTALDPCAYSHCP